MNAISVANVAIRQFDNLYSLNDLHKAAGGEKRHQPANWLRSQQAIDLIEYLKSEELESIQKKQGLGTFVSKELVVHYGMWISPAFSLKVIRAFLDTQEAVSGSPKLETQTTIDERRGLVDAVKAFAIRRNLDFPTAYRMVHQRFGVAAIEDLPREKLPDAVQYVHTLTLGGLQGEILDKPQPEEPFTADEIRAFEVCVKYLHDSMAFMRCLYRPLRDMNSSMAGRAFSLSQEPHSWLDTAQNALQRHRILSRPL